MRSRLAVLASDCSALALLVLQNWKNVLARTYFWNSNYFIATTNVVYCLMNNDANNYLAEFVTRGALKEWDNSLSRFVHWVSLHREEERYRYLAMWIFKIMFSCGPSSFQNLNGSINYLQFLNLVLINRTWSVPEFGCCPGRAPQGSGRYSGTAGGCCSFAVPLSPDNLLARNFNF